MYIAVVGGNTRQDRHQHVLPRFVEGGAAITREELNKRAIEDRSTDRDEPKSMKQGQCTHVEETCPRNCWRWEASMQ